MIEIKENIIKYTNEKYIKNVNKKALPGCKSEYYVTDFSINHDFTKIIVWVEDAFKPSHTFLPLKYEIDVEDFLDYVDFLDYLNGVKK